MRCLYCGKELALLKRLTGGAEFCSDAHRKQYQDEFNNLALSRLMQSQPNNATPESAAEPVAHAAPAPELLESVAPPAATAVAEPDEPGLAGYQLELPAASVPGESGVLADLAPVLTIVPPRWPGQEYGLHLVEHPAQELAWARRAEWPQSAEAAWATPQPRDSGVEPREFSRHASPPSLPEPTGLPSGLGADGRVSEVSGGAHMELTFPLCRAGTPEPWLGSALPAAGTEAQLGEWGRLDFRPAGWEAVPPPVHSTQSPETPAQEAPTQASLPAEPERLPRLWTEPWPVALPPARTGAPQPLEIPCAGLGPDLTPRAVLAAALPLRPAVVLRPVPAAAPVVAESSAIALRPQTVGIGKRRPDVRVVPAAPVAPALPQAARASGPNEPPPAPAVAPLDPAPAPPAPPLAAPPPQPAPPPIAVAKPESPRTESPKVAEVDLHLPELHVIEVSQGPWSRMPLPVRAGLGAVLALAIIGFAYYGFNSNPAAATPAAKTAQAVYLEGRQINTAGWIEDWAPADSTRRVTLLRGSETFSDYRMEFGAQIQRKAIGWMFRGLNPKNFYVAKIERTTRDGQPAAALVRYAVIDGKNEARVETPLDIPWRVDTLYKIRFDATGPKFAVWVQGKKVDEWRDARLGSGGLGLYSETDEVAAIHGTVNVVELVAE